MRRFDLFVDELVCFPFWVFASGLQMQRDEHSLTSKFMFVLLSLRFFFPTLFTFAAEMFLLTNCSVYIPVLICTQLKFLSFRCLTGCFRIVLRISSLSDV